MQLIVANGVVIATHPDGQVVNLSNYPSGAAVTQWGGPAPVFFSSDSPPLSYTIPDPTSFVAALVVTYSAGTPWTDWVVTATSTGPQITSWNTAKLGAQPTNAAVATIAAGLTAAQLTQAACAQTALTAASRIVSAQDVSAQLVRGIARVLVPELNAIIAAGKAGNWSSLSAITVAQAITKTVQAIQAETSPTS